MGDGAPKIFEMIGISRRLVVIEDMMVNRSPTDGIKVSLVEEQERLETRMEELRG